LGPWSRTPHDKLGRPAHATVKDLVGIDVAKDELVIHLHPQGRCWRVANTKRGLSALGRQLERLAATDALKVGFEASGGYERALAQRLDALGLKAYLLDPARVRSFARAERQIAKTDPLDAALIARCLAAIHDQLTPYVHDRQALRLAEHVRLRDLPLAQAVQLNNQLETIADAAMRRLVQTQIARLKAMALRIEQQIARLIAASPNLSARERLLRSAPGVGPIVAATLLARLPELGRLSSRQIATLAGLAPFVRQSGTRARPARCTGGRPAVRRALYLAALAIVRAHKHPFANIAKRLKTAGKPPKLIIIAIARKLLTTLNAMIKYNQSFLTT